MKITKSQLWKENCTLKADCERKDEVYTSGVTILLFAPNSGHVDSINIFVCAPPEAQRMFDALKEILRSIQRNVYNL